MKHKKKYILMIHDIADNSYRIFDRYETIEGAIFANNCEIQDGHTCKIVKDVDWIETIKEIE